MLSHQLEQNRIDGEKTIIQNPSEAQRKEHDKFEFELHEVYAVDVLISTGEGQGKERDAKISVYKKTDETYMLKMKHSREFFSQVSKKHGLMPFTLRSCENETKAKVRTKCTSFITFVNVFIKSPPFPFRWASSSAFRTS